MSKKVEEVEVTLHFIPPSMDKEITTKTTIEVEDNALPNTIEVFIASTSEQEVKPFLGKNTFEKRTRVIKKNGMKYLDTYYLKT